MAKKPAQFTPTADHRIVVLTGKEAFLISEYTSRIRGALEEKFGEVDQIRFDGETAAPADVLDECRSFGLMQQHKLVVVDRADQMVKEESRPLFVRYAEQPAEDATLLLRAERWYPGNLDKAIKKVGEIVKCDEMDPYTAIRWVIRRCEKQHGATIAQDAAAMLVDRVGVALARLDSELAKLALGAAAGDGGRPAISRETIADYVGRTREEEAWAIQEAVLSGSPERALMQLKHILDGSPRDAHIPISWSMVDLARKLHGCAEGLSAGMHPQGLAKTLRLWGPSKDAILAKAKALGPARSAQLLREAVAADRAQKTGLGRPERTLERLAIRFTSI
jgi:DNA polymerase III delta subunit